MKQLHKFLHSNPGQHRSLHNRIRTAIGLKFSLVIDMIMLLAKYFATSVEVFKKYGDRRVSNKTYAVSSYATDNHVTNYLKLSKATKDPIQTYKLEVHDIINLIAVKHDFSCF